MMTGAGFAGTKVGRNPMSIPQDHSLGSFDLGAVSSPHQFEWVKMNLDTGAAVNTCPVNFGPDGASDGKCYTERPVVYAFLTLELDNFNATTNIAQVFFYQKSHKCTQSSLQCKRDCMHKSSRFVLGI